MSLRLKIPARHSCLTNVVSGSGKLTKSGVGVLFLGGAANISSGSVNVSGGTLALTNVNSTGREHSLRRKQHQHRRKHAAGCVRRSDDTLTLTGGQALSGGTGTNGAGAINGNLIASVGSFVAPGSGTTNNGTLSVSSNATLHGTTTMKLNAATGTSDQLLANASLMTAPWSSPLCRHHHQRPVVPIICPRRTAIREPSAASPCRRRPA